MALIHDGFSQAKQRRYVILTDEHGRRWGQNIENSTGERVGAWDAPLAPLVPPGQYVKPIRDPENPMLFTGKVKIDYDRIIADGREAIAEWERQAMRFRRQQPDLTQASLEDLIGPIPPPVEPWIAAKQGDKWVLGLSDRVNLKVAAFMDLNKKKQDEEYDFTSEENYLDVEEAADPKAIGGKRVKVKKTTEPAEEAA